MRSLDGSLDEDWVPVLGMRKGISLVTFFSTESPSERDIESDKPNASDWLL